MPDDVQHHLGRDKGTLKYIPRKTIARGSSGALDGVDLWFNKRCIKIQLKKGNRIVDIGEPAGYPVSSFYDMELDQTRGYWNYVQDIQP